MNYIFVDFEMNPIHRKYVAKRKIYKQEIIEIGAIMIDDNLDEISSFKAYVKPKYSEFVTTKITDLTGITSNQLCMASSVGVELENFAKWCIEKSNNEFVVFAWSESDLDQVLNELKLKEITVSENLKRVIDSWQDLQLEYDRVTKSEKQTGLRKALESLGIYFTGKMHDALDDSRNTAIIFRELQNPEQMLANIEEIRSYYTGEHKDSITLGDLIDFSAFQISA